MKIASQPRPYLGIRADPDSKQCVVQAVAPGSAAENAGLRVGDVLAPRAMPEIMFEGEKVGRGL